MMEVSYCRPPSAKSVAVKRVHGRIKSLGPGGTSKMTGYPRSGIIPPPCIQARDSVVREESKGSDGARVVINHAMRPARTAGGTTPRSTPLSEFLNTCRPDGTCTVMIRGKVYSVAQGGFGR